MKDKKYTQQDSPSSEGDWGGVSQSKQKAFTLVELIVVVTILAILATIGFVSYSSYLTWVRDTNRLAQLVSIHDWLVLFSTRKELPLPDDNIEVKIGTTEVIWYQWYAGSNTLETIDFTKWGQDPRDGSFFTYYLTRDRKFFQLMAFLEEDPGTVANLTSPLGRGIEGDFVSLINQTKAVDFSSRIITTYGKELWILTDLSNQPVQDIPGLSAAWEVDISSSTDYRAHFDDETMFEWNWTELAAKVTLHTEHVSGFEPSDVNGLYMWFDANDSTTIEKTTGNVITQWNDKSNNNNHMNVIEWDPTYWDLIINGSKTVYFDGDDSMHTTASFDAPYTIIYVAQQEGTQNARVLWWDGNKLIGFHSGNTQAAFLEWWIRNGQKSVIDNLFVQQFSFSRDTSLMTQFYNNGEGVLLNWPTTGVVDFWKLWIWWSWPNSWLIGREKSKVYFAEAIVFDRVISDSDREKIEAYLNKKWWPF